MKQREKASTIGHGNLNKHDKNSNNNIPVDKTEDVAEKPKPIKAPVALSRSQTYNRTEYEALEEKRRRAGDTGGAWGPCIIPTN